MKINFGKFIIYVVFMTFVLGQSHAQIQTNSNYRSISDNISNQTSPLNTTDLSPKATLLSESFDVQTFPPSGWLNVAGSGSYTWQRITTSIHPAGVAPHSGAGMATYNSFSINSGNNATLISPSVNLTGNTGFYIVKMWMYHDDGYINDDDRVKILVNTTASMTGATLLGTVNRYSTTNGWLEHTFLIPASFNTSTNYVLFNAISEYGNDIYMDDVAVISDVKDIGMIKIITPGTGMLPGSIVPQVEVKNLGSFAQTNIPISYKIGTNGTVNTVTLSSLDPGATANVSFPSWTGNLGTYNFIFYTDLLEDDIRGNDTLKRDLNVVSKLNKVFCFKDYIQPASFILENPVGGFTPMGNTVPWFSRAGVYFSTSETTYKWLVLGSDKNLFSIDTLSGIVHIIGATGITDIFLSGLTYDKSTQTLYASGLDGTYPNFTFHLYTLNQTTGAATLVATSPTHGCFFEIACNTEGQMFTLESRTDSLGKLYSVNKTSGELTLIGTNIGGIVSSNPQDIEFSDNNVLYFAANKGNDGVLDGLYTINTTTGKATLVSPFIVANTPVGGIGIKTTYGASIPGILNKDNKISIFPNPVKDFISVVSKDNGMIKSVKVISLSGQLVYTENVNFIATTINTANMSAGFYFIQVLTNAGLYTQKIIVTK